MGHCVGDKLAVGHCPGTALSLCPERTWGQRDNALAPAGAPPCSLCPGGTRVHCHGDIVEDIVEGHTDSGTLPTLHALRGHGDIAKGHWGEQDNALAPSALHALKGCWDGVMGTHRQWDTALALPALGTLRGHGDNGTGIWGCTDRGTLPWRCPLFMP